MNPWLNVPYEDYIKHMENPQVQQLQTLNQIFKNRLDLARPKSLLILGCGGGNGMEHIDDKITDYVIGVDINSDYLKYCNQKFRHKNYKLTLINEDINKEEIDTPNVNFVSCYLLLEYVDVYKTLKKLEKVLEDGGYLNVLIQKSNNLDFVSQSSVSTLDSLSEIAKEVDTVELENYFEQLKLSTHEKLEHKLPNGKSFIEYWIRKG